MEPMSTMTLESYAVGEWVGGSGGRTLHSAVDGAEVAALPGTGADVAAMLHHARRVGGPALRR